MILSSEIKGKKLIISVLDNGLGFSSLRQPEKENRPHIGLRGMKERALMLKGVLIIESPPKQGTKIKIEFNNKIKK